MTNLQSLINTMHQNGSLSSALTSAGLGPLLNLQTTVYYHTPSDNGGSTPEDILTPPE
jgi:hypothetical protein